jgi:hypothetical protein
LVFGVEGTAEGSFDALDDRQTSVTNPPRQLRHILFQ